MLHVRGLCCRRPVEQTFRDRPARGSLHTLTDREKTIFLAELPSLVDEIDAGTIAVKANALLLAEVETAGSHADVPGERAVLVP
jgi:hypothetical protein